MALVPTKDKGVTARCHQHDPANSLNQFHKWELPSIVLQYSVLLRARCFRVGTVVDLLYPNIPSRGGCADLRDCEILALGCGTMI